MKDFEGIFIASAQAQTQSPANSQPKGGALVTFAPMLLVFAIFYFLMIRPQQKQRKQHAQMLSTVKKGDEVVTSSGIHARVHGVTDTILTLEIANNVQIKIDRSQVATIKTQTPAVS